MIKAITFDFWDTIVVDDSDEPKRTQQGLASKDETRKDLFVAEISKYHPNRTSTEIEQAWHAANDWFRNCWKVEHHTPTVTTRLEKACELLQIKATPTLAEVVSQYELMEVITPPDFAEGIKECLRELSQHYKLGIISDTIISPGTSLQKILKAADLLQYFQAFVFSDEVGAAKPAAHVFECAQKQFQVELSEIVHIGDREKNDVLGPNKVGMKSILYTGVIDRGTQNSQASAVCSHHDQLVHIIKKLSKLR